MAAISTFPLPRSLLTVALCHSVKVFFYLFHLFILFFLLIVSYLSSLPFFFFQGSFTAAPFFSLMKLIARGGVDSRIKRVISNRGSDIKFTCTPFARHTYSGTAACDGWPHCCCTYIGAASSTPRCAALSVFLFHVLNSSSAEFVTKQNKTKKVDATPKHWHSCAVASKRGSASPAQCWFCK